MDKEAVVHIYNGILIDHKKNEIGSFVVMQMNLESVIQSEVSQKEKQILYTNAYIWNLGRWY